jgi:hypothetical protein
LGVISSHSILSKNKKFYSYNRKSKSYIKKTPIAIKQIKFILASKKKEKHISKKSIKEVKIRKEILIKEKQKPIKKHKPIKKYDESKDTGYDVSLFEFKCKASDIKLTHSYGIRSEYSDDVLDLHNSNFPDHEVISFEFIHNHHVEYGSKINYNGITSNQREMLFRLGVNEQIIGSIKTKSEATSMITKLQG